MNDQIVLITGGSQGYGKAAAKLFAKAGAKVIIAARNEKILKTAMKETGADSYVAMDVTDADDWQQKALRHVKENYGKLDVLINNAGGAVKITGIASQSAQNINKIIDLNLKSVIYGTQTFANMMVEKRRGTIINVSSTCAKHAWPGWSVYAAAKWGVLGFSKNAYVDLQPYNIRVCSLIPGAGATDFMKHAGSVNADMKLKAEDVAQAMLDICKLSEHVVVEELIVWGIDQRVVPF